MLLSRLVWKPGFCDIDRKWETIELDNGMRRNIFR